MEAKIYNNTGKEAGNISLPDAVFGLPYNADLVHQVFTSMNSNLRANTAKTKDRSEVSGTGKKPWKQKGTGRARHGSKRSPIWVKGGVAHGPSNERNYKKKINKKMARAALFVALSEKLRNGQILFVDSLTPKEMKTKEASKMLTALSVVSGFDRLAGSQKVVAHIAFDKKEDVVTKSFNNIPFVETAELRNLNLLDVLNRRYLIIVNPKDSVAFLEAKLS
jgi:large subunit ribosomal protein L4